MIIGIAHLAINQVIGLTPLGIQLKDLNKKGEYIISEPSIDDINYFNLNNWLNNTILELKKITDRKIIIHNRT